MAAARDLSGNSPSSPGLSPVLEEAKVVQGDTPALAVTLIGAGGAPASEGSASSSFIGNVGHNTTGLADNRKVVTTAGTAVALAAATDAKWVAITAETDNTGLIVVGGSTVVAALATRRGVPLNPGDTLNIPIDNLADVFIDSTVSGDGVSFAYGV